MNNDLYTVVYEGRIYEISAEEYAALLNGWVTPHDMFG